MKKITKLAIFDFDQTLVTSPLPDEGKQLWLNKTGKPWPHAGWWSKHESLDMDVFDIQTIPSVIAEYNECVKEENTAVVMLTGRMVKLTSHVMTVLNHHNLVFDEYHLNRGGATEIEKMKSMEKLLEKYVDVDEIFVWDDRLAHIPIFQEFGDKLIASGRIKKFHITVVPSLEGGNH